MNHPIAQFAALTCYANAFLRGRMIPPFFPCNSTCTFCDWVKFFRVSRTLLGKPREEEVAGSPDTWFAHLQAANVSAVRLSCTPRKHPKISDRMSAAFADGGTWAMEAVQHNGKRAIWVSRWGVWSQNAPDRRIWRVSYGRVSTMRSSTAPATDLEALAGRFRSALADIREFSERQRCGGFTARFAEAMETLDSGGAKRHGYHKDLAPDGSVPALGTCLLDACQSAWVFGGMGSWNDMAFQGEAQAEYDRTSARLFQTLTEVILAAANASCAA